MSAYSDRLARLRDTMKATGTDLVALGPSSHMIWLSGVSPHGDERPVLLLVSQDYAGFLMPALNADAARKATDLPFETWGDAEGPNAALETLLQEAKIDRMAPSVVIDETMRADFALLLLDALPGAKRRFTGDTVGALRARKDPSEYDALKKSALLNDAAMRAGFEALRPGVTEREIATIIRDYYKAHGAMPEFTSVCFSANGAFPHHAVGETKLALGDAVLIDTGGRIDGYPSDMTRVGYLGSAPEGFAAVHAVVESAVAAALAAARPGVRASDVDKAARTVIEKAGYGEHFLHRTGHGLGLDIHEPPYITGTSDTVLEESMVFSIEPGIYLAGKFGIRLEEIVILRADGPEILSEFPRAAVVAWNRIA
ncbi:M24 family metallopeptidase [Pelagibacterium halotolerans]|uniref:M24 family metallopeptidase n=1 Tax=Pelagibacterium halotolerans TaxID=531813 RepID=UPI0038502ADB